MYPKISSNMLICFLGKKENIRMKKSEKPNISLKIRNKSNPKIKLAITRFLLIIFIIAEKNPKKLFIYLTNLRYLSMFLIKTL